MAFGSNHVYSGSTLPKNAAHVGKNKSEKTRVFAEHAMGASFAFDARCQSDARGPTGHLQFARFEPRRADTATGDVGFSIRLTDVSHLQRSPSFQTEILLFLAREP